MVPSGGPRTRRPASARASLPFQSAPRKAVGSREAERPCRRSDFAIPPFCQLNSHRLGAYPEVACHREIIRCSPCAHRWRPSRRSFKIVSIPLAVEARQEHKHGGGEGDGHDHSADQRDQPKNARLAPARFHGTLWGCLERRLRRRTRTTWDPSGRVTSSLSSRSRFFRVAPSLQAIHHFIDGIAAPLRGLLRHGCGGPANRGILPRIDRLSGAGSCNRTVTRITYASSTLTYRTSALEEASDPGEILPRIGVLSSTLVRRFVSINPPITTVWPSAMVRVASPRSELITGIRIAFSVTWPKLPPVRGPRMVLRVTLAPPLNGRAVVYKPVEAADLRLDGHLHEPFDCGSPMLGKNFHACIRSWWSRMQWGWRGWRWQWRRFPTASPVAASTRTASSLSLASSGGSYSVGIDEFLHRLECWRDCPGRVITDLFVKHDRSPVLLIYPAQQGRPSSWSSMNPKTVARGREHAGYLSFPLGGRFAE